MSLASHLEKRPPESILWISEATGTFQVSDFHRYERDFASFKQSLAGQKVALCFRSSELLARILLILDGVCKELLFLQAGPDEDLKVKLCREAATDTVISDHPMDLSLPFIDVTRPPSFLGKRNPTTPAKTVWLIPTSGTTGSPKLIPHTIQSLTRTVKNPRAHDPIRWGLLYDLARFAGLQVFFQSLLGGGTLLIPSHQADTARTLAFLNQRGCTALSATPTMWRKILMSPISKELPLNQITLGGEIADQGVLDALKTKFPSARIIHIYASTEAGVGFSVRDGIAGFPRVWLDSLDRDPILKVKEGFLWVKVAGRFDQVKRPANLELDDVGFINTGDLVNIGDDRVVFLGRSNGAINIGGSKVQPEEVEKVLLTYPKVRMASVRGRANPFTGSIVVADVVAEESLGDKMAFCRDLIQHCRQHLTPYKVPALINLVSDLELNTAGKIKRNE